MKTPHLELHIGKAPKSDAETVLVFQESDKKAVAQKGPYAATLAKLQKSGAFIGKPGSQQFLRFGGKGGSENVLFVGLGRSGDLTADKIRMAGGSAFSKLRTEKVSSFSVNVDSIEEPSLVGAFCEGLVLGSYSFEKHKSKKAEDDSSLSKISIISKNKNLKQELQKTLSRVNAVPACVNLTRNWSNEPSNIGTPEFYANEAKRIAKEAGLKCTVLGEAEAAKEKMGLFLGVGQGAEREGKIVIVEYTPPKSENSKTIALVGKGVTFDSGGISIKPSLRMEEMKHDMTGAATVMGAVMLASKWKISNRVIAIMAFTENMPNGNAIQPGNILTSRSGKTVEVINTDAEGRLILADALDFAQDMKPDAIIDVATLTGAVSIALGKQCCGILGNDSGLIEAVKKAGSENGEKIWELPLWDEYFDDMKSDVADMKNSCNDGAGGTIRGAVFLKQFIKKGMKWAHLDIAAMAWGVTHLSFLPKRGASGLYVRTLAQLAKDYA